MNDISFSIVSIEYFTTLCYSGFSISYNLSCWTRQIVGGYCQLFNISWILIKKKRAIFWKMPCPANIACNKGSFTAYESKVHFI